MQPETKFLNAVRDGYLEALPGRVEFFKQFDPGYPDQYIKIFTDKTRSTLMYDCFAEFKVRPSRPNALIKEWDLLRELQKLTMIRMAADGKNVFLVVCHEAQGEAPWYYLLPAQARKVLRHEAAPETMLALMLMSRKWKKNNKWTTGSDWGEPDEGPTESWASKLAMNRVLARKNGLVKPKGLILPK